MASSVAAGSPEIEEQDVALGVEVVGRLAARPPTRPACRRPSVFDHTSGVSRSCVVRRLEGGDQAVRIGARRPEDEHPQARRGVRGEAEADRDRDVARRHAEVLDELGRPPGRCPTRSRNSSPFVLAFCMVRSPTVSGMSASRSATAPSVKDGRTPSPDGMAASLARLAASRRPATQRTIPEAAGPHATRTKPATAVKAMLRNRFTSCSSSWVSKSSRILDGAYLR